MKPLLVSFLQHDYDDDDPEDIPTEDLPIGKSSVGILGVCHNDKNDHDDGITVLASFSTEMLASVSMRTQRRHWAFTCGGDGEHIILSSW